VRWRQTKWNAGWEKVEASVKMNIACRARSNKKVQVGFRYEARLIIFANARCEAIITFRLDLVTQLQYYPKGKFSLTSVHKTHLRAYFSTQ
jgi:hypothetical protein